MLEKITPEIRKTLVQGLVDSEINLADLGYKLTSTDELPASLEEIENWEDFKPLDDYQKAAVRKGLFEGRIDLDRLFYLYPYPKSGENL
jgi:hypothetical protein